MLALKVALLEIKSVPILIFDEIDAGIGGAVANAVGERLKLLSKTLQILVVTHHPQIAAKANCHLKVQKTTQQNITKTQITVLDLQAREQEVARMLAAENITDEAIAAARKLME
jgi:DNA repair protein RecN (Recombination protein N)